MYIALDDALVSPRWRRVGENGDLHITPRSLLVANVGRTVKTRTRPAGGKSIRCCCYVKLLSADPWKGGCAFKDRAGVGSDPSPDNSNPEEVSTLASYLFF